MAKTSKSTTAVTYVESIKQEILALQKHQDAQMKTLLDKLKVAEEEEERKNATGLITQAVATAKGASLTVLTGMLQTSRVNVLVLDIGKPVQIAAKGG